MHSILPATCRCTEREHCGISRSIDCGIFSLSLLFVRELFSVSPTSIVRCRQSVISRSICDACSRIQCPPRSRTRRVARKKKNFLSS
ncbi:hypothetical protein PUN28_015670 [Cardiocondyla obscurior]|uniref:Uncharacterized protein n=1 Tax=Cardiocondyla obscurior TaxID=286306 RepID=A0AAW2EU79_9HYME